MNSKIGIFLLCTILLIGCGFKSKQSNRKNMVSGNNRFRLIVNSFVNQESLDSSLIQIYGTIRKKAFVFIKDKATNEFNASISINLKIIDNETEKQVYIFSESFDISEETYELTRQNENMYTFKHNTYLPSGDYKFLLVFHDYQNDVSWRSTSRVYVNNHSDFNAIGIYNKILKTDLEFKPIDYLNVENLDTLWIQFEGAQKSYNDWNVDQISDISIFKNQSMLAKFNNPEILDMFFKRGNQYIESAFYPIAISKRWSGVLRFEINYKNKMQDVFYLNIINMVQNYFFSNIGKMSYVMGYLWGDSKNALTDLSEDEKWDYIDSYWHSKDPSIGTKDNELLNEFNKRLEFVESKFSSISRNGYKTDQGRIYILYGAPEYIENISQDNQSNLYQNNQSNLNFQVWHYSPGMKFTFRQSVFGSEYILVDESF